MKTLSMKTCMAMLLAMGMLSACSSHCTCPPQAAAPGTTIVEAPR